MTQETFFFVDAFTGPRSKGNPAAVCLLNFPRDPQWMLQCAAGMNLSETAFAIPEENDFRLRWFTPVCEVDLCGHATLATAFVLWETGVATRSKPIRFQTRSGFLEAQSKGNIIELDFPADPPNPCETPPELATAIGAPWNRAEAGRAGYILELACESLVRKIRPDFEKLKILAPQGVAITARSASPEYDFVSRVFAPAEGINEDPVTGSAHCCLGPYWQRRLNKTKMLAHQASDRGGDIRIRIRGDRVILGGQAAMAPEPRIILNLA